MPQKPAHDTLPAVAPVTLLRAGSTIRVTFSTHALINDPLLRLQCTFGVGDLISHSNPSLLRRPLTSPRRLPVEINDAANASSLSWSGARHPVKRNRPSRGKWSTKSSSFEFPPCVEADVSIAVARPREPCPLSARSGHSSVRSALICAVATSRASPGSVRSLKPGAAITAKPVAARSRRESTSRVTSGCVLTNERPNIPFSRSGRER